MELQHSPTSSSISTYSSPFLPSKLLNLPVMALRDKIVEKILDNRVTLIVGETGCGKSSQVPQFLLEENIEPILCTQPRRFAVVAVAKMVAKSRNCELGGEVGYHIGHSKHISTRSKIIFKTAGVLLDEMMDRGLNALQYKVIILDEVHERSVESDLVLVCVKQLMQKNNDLRLVLMSATADITRYKDYFKELDRGERVEVLAIPSTNQQTNFQRRVSYLEQTLEALGIDSELLSRYCPGPSPSRTEADIHPAVHKLIHDMILYIHDNEPDIEKSILVFLPTYHDLEQQWHLLKPLQSSFRVHILHRSIDTEQALLAMKILKSHRKVILATNIAESSVTIPKVAYVIDSCRSLQVFWDGTRKKDHAKLVWVSKSQAEQRKGRTGRTCDGQIFRLVSSSFFNKLEEHECPAILRLSLRSQVLLICCSESKAINDPKVLLQRALDPPDLEVVKDAMHLLVQMKALEKTHRGRHEATFYGRLLASCSLSFDASVIVLKFGDSGMLREGILLGILMDILPSPILRPFGQQHLFTEYTNCYFNGDNNTTIQIGRKETSYLANLCAYQFWQRVFKDKHRLEHLKQLLMFDELNATSLLISKVEEEWCLLHHLVQSSLYQISDIYEDILTSMHRFRPKFLGASDSRPTYYDPYEFNHTCLIKCQPSEDTGVGENGKQNEKPCETMTCTAVPFVYPNQFEGKFTAEKLANAIKEIRVQYQDEAHHSQHEISNVLNVEPSLCVFFVKGFCRSGSECLFSHSLHAKRPECKFFFSLQGCRNGASCFFSHDLGPSVATFSSASCVPEGNEVSAEPLVRLLPTCSDGYILLLEDPTLSFSANLAKHYDPSKIMCTTSLSETSINAPALTGIRIIWEVDNLYKTIIGNSVPWNEVKCVLWFPNLDSYNQNLDAQRSLLQSFFEYLAVRILADDLYEVGVILVMNNIKFSVLQVEKLGRESFFSVRESFPFDEDSFGKVSDRVTTNKQMVVSRPIAYVFDIQPPTDIQFGNYGAQLHKSLHDIGGGFPRIRN